MGTQDRQCTGGFTPRICRIPKELHVHPVSCDRRRKQDGPGRVRVEAGAGPLRGCHVGLSGNAPGRYRRSRSAGSGRSALSTGTHRTAKPMGSPMQNRRWAINWGRPGRRTSSTTWCFTLDSLPRKPNTSVRSGCRNVAQQERWRAGPDRFRSGGVGAVRSMSCHGIRWREVSHGAFITQAVLLDEPCLVSHSAIEGHMRTRMRSESYDGARDAVAGNRSAAISIS